MRVAIVGGPGTGKTTLALKLCDGGVISTDDYLRVRKHMGDQAFMDAVCDRCESSDAWVLEGCRAIHALHEGVGVDLVLWMQRPYVDLAGPQCGYKDEIDSMVEGYMYKYPETPVLVMAR